MATHIIEIIVHGRCSFERSVAPDRLPAGVVCNLSSRLGKDEGELDQSSVHDFLSGSSKRWRGVPCPCNEPFIRITEKSGAWTPPSGGR